MPQKDFSKSVFKADASAASDWGSIGAGAAIDLRGSIELKRGIDIDLGLMAMANLDASFSQYLTADLQGSAQAQASVRAQIELPMNLFDELGAAVRLQAIAELAAGVRLGVGLALGDFIALAGEDPRNAGVPLRLLRVFLEEVELELGFFAKAALSAQVYANLVVTGTAIANPATGARPGFTIAAGAGAGLKAGAGFQVFGSAGVESFGRLVSRSTDIVVDDTVLRLAHALPAPAAPVRAVLFGSRPAFKIALRLAFELGEQFANPALAHDAAGQAALSTRGLQVVLEELQRAVCDGVLRASVDALHTLLQPVRAARQAWDGCRAERHALADALESAPAPLSSSEAIDAWLDLMGHGSALAAKLSANEPQLIDRIAMGWAALKLAARIGERVSRAAAGVSVIGAPPQQVARAFAGPMTGSVPPAVKTAIEAALAAAGAPVNGPLAYEHLAVYLGRKAVADLLVQANPGLADFLGDLCGPIAADVPTLLRLVLDNASSFAVGGGAPDPTAALTAIAAGLQGYVGRRMSAAFRSALEPAFAGNEDLRIYVDEVLLPTLDFALAVTLHEAVGWATSARPAKVVTEALSAVLLKLVGRSLVAVADCATAHVQASMSELMLRAADQAGRPNGLVAVLSANPALSLAARDIAELVSDALHVGAEVFGPLPAERRARIRGLLYDVLDPAGGATPAQLMQALENPALVPNEAALRGLAQELGEVATERFVLFVQGFVMRLLERLAAAWLAALAAAIAVAEQFLADLSQAIALIQQRLEEIGRALQALADRIAAATAAALGDLDDLLDGFSSSAGRSRFVNELAGAVSGQALAALEDNWAYRNLVPGGVRSEVRARVRAVVRDLLDAAPFDEFLAALGAIRDQAAEIVDDARSLDRDAPLAPQVAELLIARLAGLVADRYGSVRIRVAFGFHWNTPLGRVDQDFDLGRIRVRVGDVADIVRPVARGLGAFEAAVDALADRLRDIFDAEADSADLQTEREAASSEQQRLVPIAAERHAGPQSVVIERPVPMQVASASTLATIRLEGFAATLLRVDEHTPQRLFILLNGTALALDAFRVEVLVPTRPPAALGAPVRRHQRDAGQRAGLADGASRTALTSRATIGSRVLSRPTAPLAALETLREPATALPALRVSGHLPAALLVEGLNTLMVTIVTGPGLKLGDTVGFLSPAAPVAHAPPAGRPVGPRPTLGRDGLPEAVPTGPAAAGRQQLVLPSERRLAARSLARATVPPAVQPLARLARSSPLLAQRAGIVGVQPLPRPGSLRPAVKPKKGSGR